MATIFVNSAASGANNGTSKTNAFTSLVGALTTTTEASGDIFEIAHTHSEAVGVQLGANLNAAGANKGCRFRSINYATDFPTFGATFTMAGNTVQLPGLIEGIHFDNSASATDLTIVPQLESVFRNCKFSKQAAQGVIINTAHGKLLDCEIAAGTSYSVVFKTTTSFAEWVVTNLLISGTKSADVALLTQGASSNNIILTINNSDLTMIDTFFDHVTGSANGNFNLILNHCAIVAAPIIEKGSTYIDRRGGTIILNNCRNGTLSTPLYEEVFYSHYGSCIQDLTRYRSGGGGDDAVPNSWALTAAGGRTWLQSQMAIASPIFVVPVRTTDTSLTFYLAHNAVGAGTAGAIRNSEFWVTAHVPGSTAKGNLYSSMAPLDGTAASDYASDASTWTGTLVGTKQKVTLTIAPAVDGVAVCQAFFAPDNASDKLINFDPFVVVA